MSVQKSADAVRMPSVGRGEGVCFLRASGGSEVKPSQLVKNTKREQLWVPEGW